MLDQPLESLAAAAEGPRVDDRDAKRAASERQRWVVSLRVLAWVGLAVFLVLGLVIVFSLPDWYLMIDQGWALPVGRSTPLALTGMFASWLIGLAIYFSLMVQANLAEDLARLVSALPESPRTGIVGQEISKSGARTDGQANTLSFLRHRGRAPGSDQRDH